MSTSQALGGVRSGFQGSRVAAPTKRCGTKSRASSRLVVLAEKVVGIDLGTTNSAVRPYVDTGGWRHTVCWGPSAPVAHVWKTVSLEAAT